MKLGRTINRILVAASLFYPAIGWGQDRLVIISPHWEGIRYEFGTGFKSYYQVETGRTAEIEWMDVGGASEMLRFIKSEFKTKPNGIDVDMVFGGGGDTYLDMAHSGVLTPYRLPDKQLDRIPANIGGYPLFDAQYLWYGATMAGFGIVFNRRVMDLVHLPEPKTWEDLTNPVYFSWIGAADPRKSGSAHMPFEIILQAYGWDRGWQIITALGANSRNFANSASQVPKDVTAGEVAYGMAIDFYAWAQVNEVGPEMIGYTLPDNLTIINPDPIAILRGARNLPVAQAFLRYVFTEGAQRLWLQKPGTPEGPKKFQLDRFAVLPDLYNDIDPSQTSVRINPFKWSSSFVYDPGKGSARWSVINDLVGVFIIDAHKALQARWKRAIKEGNTGETLKQIAVMPVTEEEAMTLGTDKWRDPAFRNRTLLAWGKQGDDKYGSSGSGSPVSEALALLASGLMGVALVGYLWSVHRKRSG